MAGLRWPTEAEYRAHGAPPFRHVRALTFTPIAIDEKEQTIRLTVSTDQWARDGQRVLPQAWERNLPLYMENPQVTWAHSWWQPGIGLAREVSIRPNGLEALLWIDGDADDVRDIWRAIQTTRVRCASVAWDGDMVDSWEPKLGDSNECGAWVAKPDGRLGWEWRYGITLMEIAMVPIPADTGANMMLQRSLGIGGPWKSEMTGEQREEAEEARVIEHLRGLSGIEDLRNYYRAVEKSGGGPSPEVIEQVLRPISSLVEIATGRKREGKVLSAANLEKVQAAHDALAALLEAAGAGGRGASPPAPLRSGEGRPGEGNGRGQGCPRHDGGLLGDLLTPQTSCLAEMLGG